MQSELICPRCEQSYDTQERTPQMLPRCGHSTCMKCLKQQSIIVCSEDGMQQPNDLSLYPLNQTILKMINRSSLRNSQLDSTELGESLRISRCDNFLEVMDPSFMCAEHHKRIELVCLDDFYKICVNCALFGGHKHHNVRNLDEVIGDIQHNVEETINLVQQVQSKVKTLKQPQINRKIRDHIRVCIKQQQIQAEEQFKEIITQIMLKQRKVMEEIEHRFKQIEEQMIKREQQIIGQIMEKAELWMLAAQEKLNSFATTTEKGDIAFQLISKDTSYNQAKQILEEVDEFMKHFQNRLVEVTVQQNTPGISAKDMLSNFEYSYPSVQQSFMDDPNILRDVSVIDQSFLKELDDRPPHNEFLMPSIILPSSCCTTQSAIALKPLTSIESRKPSQHDVQSPKLRRQQSMSPKRVPKKKLTLKAEQILAACNGETLDISQQELGDDGLMIVIEQIKGKKIKILKLMRNKISDTGAVKLLELNMQAIHLQSNVITERFLDLLLQMQSKGVVIPPKSIYLNQNLMNLFRVKKKVEEIKKLGIIIQL